VTVAFDKYEVKIRFADRLVGGIPVVPEGADRADAYEGWARGQGVEPENAAALSETLAEDADMPVTAEQVEGLQTGFRRDPEQGLYIEARQVKACLREAAQRLGLIVQKRGARQVLQHDLHVRAPDGSQKLFLGRSEPDGADQRPISVVTRQGPRTAIKRFEYVTQADLTFHVLILAGGVGKDKAGAPIIGQQELTDMLELAQMLGLGADRSQGEGTFDLISVEAVAS
jgi:hypothetical protein